MIVTIDGPAGSGKSTAACGLAKRLGFHFLDTGAMYRVVAYQCIENKVDINDEQAVAETARRLEITFSKEQILADGADVADSIRTPEVTNAASVVAANAAVRKVLAALQRKMAEGLNVVTEGRDQGTFVFPDAQCKFYLTAEAEERARRRQQEMQQGASSSSFDEILAQIRERDQRDERRLVAPLKQAPDAVVVDTSNMNRKQVLDYLEASVREKLNA